MSKAIDLGKKLLELARRGGTEHEAAAAKKLLLQHLEKHGLSLEEIEEVRRTRYFVNTGTCLDAARFFIQIVASVAGEVKSGIHKNLKKGYILYYEVTPAEKVEIMAKFDFYWPLLRSELDAFYHGFVLANELWLKGERKKQRELNEDEIAALERAQQLAKMAKQQAFLKRLEQ